jgi:AcrR family transcriptional regulator
MKAVPRRGPGRPRHPIERGTLIAIAAKIFAELGYTTASLGEIAEAAGLRKASLYHHFSTKESLYAAVLDTAVLELRDLLIAARLDQGDFVERLDRLGAFVTDYFAAHAHTAILLTREMLGDGEYLRSGGGQAIQTNLEATATFLEAGMETGAFRRQDPKHLALSIVGLHVQYFATAITASRFLGRDVFAPKTVEERKTAVLAQVRALCLPAPGPTRRGR